MGQLIQVTEITYYPAQELLSELLDCPVFRQVRSIKIFINPCDENIIDYDETLMADIITKFNIRAKETKEEAIELDIARYQ